MVRIGVGGVAPVERWRAIRQARYIGGMQTPGSPEKTI